MLFLYIINFAVTREMKAPLPNVGCVDSSVKFGQLLAHNLLFLFNPFLPVVTWHPVAFIICSHSNLCCCFRRSFHPWVSNLGCITPSVADGAAVRSCATFSASFSHLPVSRSLLFFSGDPQQPHISKALGAWCI